MRKLRDILPAVGRAARRVFTTIAGRWQWEPPPWLGKTAAGAGSGAVSGHIASGLLAVGLVALVAAVACHGHADSRPRRHRKLTEYNDSASRRSLGAITTIRRPSDEETMRPARLPAIPGTWFWLSDRELQFTPKDDWPVDGDFAVRMPAKGLLAAHITLEDYRFSFRSHPFVARISASQFYQDPVDPNLKKLVATVAFSHPVDPGPFESHVSLLAARDAEYLGLAANSRQFTVVYDKFKLNAHVHSVPLAMPRDHALSGTRRRARGATTRPAGRAVVMIPRRAACALALVARSNRA
jgi:hypothetical protein